MSDPKTEKTESKKNGRKTTGKILKIFLIVIAVIVAIVIAAVVGAYTYYRHVFNQIILPETEANIILPEDEEFDTDEPWWEETDEIPDTEDTGVSQGTESEPPESHDTVPPDTVSDVPVSSVADETTKTTKPVQSGTKDTEPAVPGTESDDTTGAEETPEDTSEFITDPPDTGTDDSGVPGGDETPGDTEPDISVPPDTETSDPVTIEPDTTETEIIPSETVSDTSEPPDTDPVVPVTSESESQIVTDPPVTQPAVTPTIDPADVVWPTDLIPVNDDGLINIMLVGQDNRTFSERGKSDSMILLSVNLRSGKISMISIMRDLYVQLGNGYSDNKLNMAYKFGGFPLLFDVMERNFGITCDYGVVVNFNSFEQIIETLGGVDLTFTQAEVDYLIGTCKVGQMPDGSMIKAGLNRNVPAKTALAYSRIRKIDSDFYRTGRQRALLLSLYNKFRGASLGTILDLVGQITDFVRLYGMTSNGLLRLVTQLYPLLGNEIVNGRIPSSNSEFKYAYIRKMAVLVPDLNKIRATLINTLPLE